MFVQPMKPTKLLEKAEKLCIIFHYAALMINLYDKLKRRKDFGVEHFMI